MYIFLSPYVYQFLVKQIKLNIQSSIYPKGFPFLYLIPYVKVPSFNQCYKYIAAKKVQS